MELSTSWEPAGRAAIRNFLNILSIRRFITVFTKDFHVSLNQINAVRTTQSYFSKIHFTIIISPTSMSYFWSVSFWLSHQNPISYSSSSMRATFSTHFIWTWSFKLYLKSTRYEAPHRQLSPPSYSFIQLQSRFSPEHPVLKHPHTMFFL
jgi:hypothetical protein